MTTLHGRGWDNPAGLSPPSGVDSSRVAQGLCKARTTAVGGAKSASGCREPGPSGLSDCRGRDATATLSGMSRVVGSALSPALIDRLSQRQLGTRLGVGLPFVTQDAEGRPHPMLVSYLELRAYDSGTLGLVIQAAQRQRSKPRASAVWERSHYRARHRRVRQDSRGRRATAGGGGRGVRPRLLPAGGGGGPGGLRRRTGRVEPDHERDPVRARADARRAVGAGDAGRARGPRARG